MPHTQKVVHNFKSLTLGRVIHSSNICNHGIFRGGVIFQKRHDGKNTRWGNVNGELILPYGDLLDVLRKTRYQILAIRVQTGCFFLIFIGRIDHGRFKFSSSYELGQLPVQFPGIMGLILRGRVACLMLGRGSWATTSLTRTAVQLNCRLLDDWTDLLTADQNTLCGFDLLPTRIAMAAATNEE